MLCSCTNPTFGTIFVPEIWAKMISANHIAGSTKSPTINYISAINIYHQSTISSERINKIA